jgi:replicative DNA helicase
MTLIDGARGSTGSGEFDRTPPQAIEAEQSVLGGMMLSKDAIADVVEVIRPGDFYRPAHQLIYDAVLDLYARGEPADAVTVSAELTRTGQLNRVGGAPYLHTLISLVPTAANAGYYAEIVADRATLRRLVTAGTRIVQMGYDVSSGGSDVVGSVDDVVDRAQAEIYDVTERRTSEDYIRIESLLQATLDEIEKISATGGIGTGIPTGFQNLDEITNGLHPGQMVTVAGRPGSGKALALDTPLPTPTGWTTMGGVQVGDELIGADGKPTRVVAATEVMTGRPCYEVEFSDGAVITADAQHEWLTITRNARRAAQPANGPRRTYIWNTPVYSRRALSHAVAERAATPLPTHRPAAPTVVTTEHIAATLLCTTADRRANHAIACASAIQLPAADLLVPPYTLGAWLGDGASDSATLTCADQQILDNVGSEGIVVTAVAGNLRYRLSLPRTRIAIRACEVCGREFRPALPEVRTCSRCRACAKRIGSLQARLRTLGVLGQKHIPTSYLRASEPQRRALLRGLLDTDGYATPQGSVEFAVTTERLANDVFELVVGLGYRAALRTKRVPGRTEASSTSYTVSFTTSHRVFGLDRKAERQVCATRNGTSLRYIVDVRPIASVSVRCVQVDNDDHMYLAGRTMIPTHNSTLALDFARSAAVKNQKPTAIFSLEMGRLEIMMRLFSAEAGVRLNNMRSGHMSDVDWRRLALRSSELADAPLFIDDSPNLTMMEIRAKARRLKQRHDLSLVVIDYLQLMTSGKRVESRQQEVSEFSRAMKLLAKELDVPVVALSQLNRGPEQRTDKKPMLADLRESGSIEQDSDVVLLVHRPDLYEPETERAGEADLIIAKHRNGPTGTVAVSFQGHYSRFQDMAS